MVMNIWDLRTVGEIQWKLLSEQLLLNMDWKDVVAINLLIHGGLILSIVDGRLVKKWMIM